MLTCIVRVYRARPVDSVSVSGFIEADVRNTLQKFQRYSEPYG